MITFNASELHRVMACQGSKALNDPLPKPPQTDDAKEGDAAHWVALQFMTAKDTADVKLPKKAPNGWPIDNTMEFHAVEFVNTMAKGPVHHAEFECNWLLTDDIEIRVRTDWCVWDESTATLHIEDYKYGWKPVDVEGNWQLIAGAIGAARKLGVQPEHFVLTIHQPRPFHRDGRRRSWEITPDELTVEYMYLHKTLTTLSDQLVTGDHCRGCKAGPEHCVAHRTATYNAIDVVLNSQATTLSGGSHAVELEILERAQKLVKERLGWLEDLAKERIKRGEVIPGRALEPAYGKKAWKSTAAVKRVAKEAGIKLMESKPVTPAEAIRRGVDEKMITDNTDRPKLGQKLVKSSAAEQVKRMHTNE